MITRSFYDQGGSWWGLWPLPEALYVSRAGSFAASTRHKKFSSLGVVGFGAAEALKPYHKQLA